MVDRDTKADWAPGIETGDDVDGFVVKHAPFGVFVTVAKKFVGFIERIQMERDGYETPQEYPPIGARVNGRVIGFRHWSHQIEIRLQPKNNGQE